MVQICLNSAKKNCNNNAPPKKKKVYKCLDEIGEAI